MANPLPKTMKAIQISQFVKADQSNLDQVMTMDLAADVPLLKKKNQILIKVLACSFSPGDIIMAQGNIIFMHPERFPYVPGMDVCGKVVNANDSTKFRVGDIVVADNGMTLIGGMAEYMAVPESEAVLKPTSLPEPQSAASSSAITARNAVMDYVSKGDRVLILGGSGGVGSAAITIAKKHADASFIATTSTQVDLCKSLGADVVIDYRKDNWWDMEWEKKFDVIIDTVGGGNFVNKANRVIKTRTQGGTFVAVVGDDPKPDATSWWKAIKWAASLPGRPLYTWFRRRTLPKYVLLMPYDSQKGRKQVLGWMEEKAFDVHLDDKSPHPFTIEGVREAFRTVASGHAHGKVVVVMP